MKAISIHTGKEIKAGDTVWIYKVVRSKPFEEWIYSGNLGVFEEITEGGLINFTCNGKPRQCLPRGAGVRIE